MAQRQQFREDLLYRLDVVTIEIPALKHRKEDILPLIDHFLGIYRGRFNQSPVEGFTAAALARFMDYPWPGNVRELSHVVQRMVVLGRRALADVDDLPQALRFDSGNPMDVFTHVLPARELQHRYAQWALERCGGLKNRTAESLDIDIKTLNRWLQDGPIADPHVPTQEQA
jgi:two-component system response regulator HydG